MFQIVLRLFVAGAIVWAFAAGIFWLAKPKKQKKSPCCGHHENKKEEGEN